MTFAGFSRPFGTCGIPNLNPAVNCRAIFKSPSGREKTPGQWVQTPPTQQKRGATETCSVSLKRFRGTHARWLGVAFAAWLTCVSFLCAGADAPSFRFQTNDVIAFVGGEDVVEMQRNGYLELLLTVALPDHKLRFRNLAFEGDTVFEQHRQLNFPSWEKQLERVGATVVVAQFGQAESLTGTNRLADFVSAYEKLLNRFTSGGRRLVLLSPTPFEKAPDPLPEPKDRNAILDVYVDAIRRLAQERKSGFVDLFTHWQPEPSQSSMPSISRDGSHLNSRGQWNVAREIFTALGFGDFWVTLGIDARSGAVSHPRPEPLRQLIIEKNRLWFDYWRPQNWAFLHGDRTEQPSSRDHRDPKKRWFPEEMERFLPLIEEKEREIWKAAANLAKGK